MQTRSTCFRREDLLIRNRLPDVVVCESAREVLPNGLAKILVMREARSERKKLVIWQFYESLELK